MFRKTLLVLGALAALAVPAALEAIPAGAATIPAGKITFLYGQTSPDLSAFKARGGKLIQYHGWSDPAIPALDSILIAAIAQGLMNTRARRAGG